MTTHAAGIFEVTMNPHPPYDSADGVNLGRISITKTFSGQLEGTSTVEMIGAITSVKGSAGYVAIERVTGVLNGKRGTFVLQHSGTMNRGSFALTVTVVPDTGTEELVGLAGAMTIDVVDEKHLYTFDYTLQP